MQAKEQGVTIVIKSFQNDKEDCFIYRQRNVLSPYDEVISSLIRSRLHSSSGQWLHLSKSQLINAFRKLVFVLFSKQVTSAQTEYVLPRDLTNSKPSASKQSQVRKETNKPVFLQPVKSSQLLYSNLCSDVPRSDVIM
jgi:hypothetical protein